MDAIGACWNDYKKRHGSEALIYQARAYHKLSDRVQAVTYYEHFLAQIGGSPHMKRREAEECVRAYRSAVTQPQPTSSRPKTNVPIP